MGKNYSKNKNINTSKNTENRVKETEDKAKDTEKEGKGTENKIKETETKINFVNKMQKNEIIHFTKETKIIKSKQIISRSISCIGLIKYNDINHIIVGLSDEFIDASFEIYNLSNFELIGKNDTDMKNEFLLYFGQISNNTFLAAGDYLAIFSFYYEDNIFSMKLLQKICIKYNHYCYIVISFIFNKDLYIEYDLHEKEKRIKKNKNMENPEGENEELVINTSKGIYIYTRKKDDLFTMNKREDNTKINIIDQMEKMKANPFNYKEVLSSEYNYDIVQVNFKYIAASSKNYLYLYSMEASEIVTKFSVKTSYLSYKVLAMLTNDILFVGGGETISLISIKDFQIIFISLVKEFSKITEICILNDFNILVSTKSLKNNDEHLFHYKYNSNTDKLTNKINYNITKLGEELITTKESNFTMVSLGLNFVTIVEKKFIQIRDLNA